MDIPLLKDVVIIFVLAMVVVYVSHRFKLPVIVGLLVTGVLAGPHALGLIDGIDEVDKLAKIGVILLLFTIKRAGIPYVVVEANAETVRRERAQNEPIYYGDATHEAVLNRVNIAQARTVVIVIAEAASTRRIAALARKLNPRAYIIARTRYVGEMEALYKIGVNEVIPEEFETSVEIFTRVLTKYLVPKDEIASLLAEIRADGYQMFRTISSAASMSVADLNLHLRDIEIAPISVAPDSLLAEKSLAEIDLRKKTGLTLLAIRRGSQILTNLDAKTKIQPSDELFVIGSPHDVATVSVNLIDQKGV